MSQAALNVRNREVSSEQRRNKRVQRVGIIFLLTVLGGIFWGGWEVLHWMKDVEREPISKLVVTGDRRYTSNDDIRKTILALGAPKHFMEQDVDIILQQIERITWVKQASVRKQWPDELKIHLVEYVPVAHWNDSLMMDAEGKLFSISAERLGKQQLPFLSGPEGSESNVLAAYREMNTLLIARKYQLKSLVMTARHSWRLILNNGVRLELGRDEQIKRLQRFIEIYPLLQQRAQTENKRVNYVDLRYDSGASVGWLAEAAEPQGGGRLNNDKQQNQVQAKKP